MTCVDRWPVAAPGSDVGATPLGQRTDAVTAIQRIRGASAVPKLAPCVTRDHTRRRVPSGLIAAFQPSVTTGQLTARLRSVT